MGQVRSRLYNLYSSFREKGAPFKWAIGIGRRGSVKH